MTPQAPPLTVAMAELHDQLDGLLVSGDRMVMVSEDLDEWEVKWVAAVATAAHQGGPHVDPKALAARQVIPMDSFLEARKATTSALAVAGLLEVPLEAVIHRWWNLVESEFTALQAAPPVLTVPRPDQVRRYRVKVGTAPEAAGLPSTPTPTVGTVTMNLPVVRIPAPSWAHPQAL